MSLSGRCGSIVLAAFLASFMGCGDGGGNGSAAELHFEDVEAVGLGFSTNVCIDMTGGEDRIAGIQMNLRWDDTCITPANGGRLCRVNPATGKTVQSALQGRGVLKAILLSFSDVEPIPDGQLFCCEFQAVGNEGTECLVEATAIIGASPTGTRINGFDVINEAVVHILP